MSVFPLKIKVVSEVKFARVGEIEPTNASWRRTMEMTSPVVASHVTPVHPVHGSGPIHVIETASGHPAAAKKSSNTFTLAEHATPAAPQKDPLS